MLSLKSATTSQMAATKVSLLDVPPELLPAVLDHVYNFHDLLSASLVSKTLRCVVLPILFGYINLTFTTRVKRNGETIAQQIILNISYNTHPPESLFDPAVAKINPVKAQ